MKAGSAITLPLSFGYIQLIADSQNCVHLKLIITFKQRSKFVISTCRSGFNPASDYAKTTVAQENLR